MDYDQFDTEYGKLVDVARSLSPANLAVEVERLRTLARTVEPPSDQEAAQLLMTSLDRALSITVPEPSDAMRAAAAIHTRARTTDGTLEERIAHLNAGIDEIARIATTADPSEQGVILDLNESLSMLAESLEFTLAEESDGHRGG